MRYIEFLDQRFRNKRQGLSGDRTGAYGVGPSNVISDTMSANIDDEDYL